MQNQSTSSLHSRLEELDGEVRGMLIEDLPKQLRQFEACITRADWSAARDVVHTISGSASFCRLRALHESAQILESSLDAGRSDSQQIIEFNNKIKEVLQLLELIENNGEKGD